MWSLYQLLYISLDLKRREQKQTILVYLYAKKSDLANYCILVHVI